MQLKIESIYQIGNACINLDRISDLTEIVLATPVLAKLTKLSSSLEIETVQPNSKLIKNSVE